MDKDIQEYYEARFDMMASKGWKDLMEDTQKMLDAYNKIERLTGVEDLHYAKPLQRQRSKSLFFM